jgi:hypothetical protein
MELPLFQHVAPLATRSRDRRYVYTHSPNDTTSNVTMAMTAAMTRTMSEEGFSESTPVEVRKIPGLQ